ncbi:two-component sensor histidine kinase [Bifidobacterium sp. MA2]|uniref:histidine kinase n=1 Tax=Bifidobacterium santillanense TaxID=2809028 RepID=A0ABS5UM40_9BIFI|nr:histidine kinase [Bifidobacterium santillanense]MBT1171959.1 two-component sensor histidine kinase [Bifidobacterium santillanense]
MKETSTTRSDTVWNRPAAFWRSNPAARMAMPVLCLVYDVMMVTRLVFAGSSADPAAWALTQRGRWGLPLLVILCLASVSVLPLRTRRPFAVLCSTCATYLCGSAFAVQPYLWPPLCVAMYCCAALADMPRACAGIVLTAASLTAGAWLSNPSVAGGLAATMPMTLPLAAVVSLASWSRVMRTRREDAARIDEARARADEAAAQRDMMEARARLSAELHDSVGHDLTAIIALAEGLRAVNGDEALDEAIDTIATLGRQALDDTRRVARSLNPVRPAAAAGEADAGATGGKPAVHGWDDVDRVLSTARATGITAVLTETGTRPADATQADLCFTVSREAVTNAMRHGRDVTSIVVSWDHHADGSMTVTVRDDGGRPHGSGDGSPRPAARAVPSGEESRNHHHPSDGDGTGLARLRERLARTGGALEAGPSDDGDGWTLRAQLPVTMKGER